MNLITQFLNNKKGNVAIITGIIALPLFAVTATVIDYVMITRAKSAMQNAADAAVLASARELGLANTQDSSISEIAKDYVETNLGKNLKLEADGNALNVDTSISDDRKDVTVNLAYYWKPILTQYINSDVLPIRVTATASLVGNQIICVIALDGSSSYSLAMVGESSITANDCAIYSNSNSPNGISTVRGSLLNTANTYSVGGYNGPGNTFQPAPITDSPFIEDPLRERVRPTAGTNCDYNLDRRIDRNLRTLNPGTYCGGLRINGNYNIRMNPGIYIMKDGPLEVGGNATLRGENVGFVFEGNASTFDFGVSTQINISAPVTGAMAGILFFEDRNAISNRPFTIQSKDAERFEGTVYLPKGKLIVDKESRVGQLSNWTAIIANKIEIRNGPELEINSNYAESDIPVPEGIGPNASKARLSR